MIRLSLTLRAAHRADRVMAGAERLVRIEMIGGLRAVLPGRELTRFRTKKTAALLAYLASSRQPSHWRDELTNLLWPEADPDRAKSSLSQAVSSLRHQLEPPGTPYGSVLTADRETVGINPEAFSSDVGDFREALATEAKARARGMGVCDRRLTCGARAFGPHPGPRAFGTADLGEALN